MKYIISRDDGETTVAPLDGLFVVEVPDDKVGDFYDLADANATTDEFLEEFEEVAACDHEASDKADRGEEVPHRRTPDLDRHYENPSACEWCDTVAPDCWLNKTMNGFGGYMHIESEMRAECDGMRGDAHCPVHSEKENN